ncbi:serine/threonine-protein kinase [Streptomyces sp. NPDC088116]|uniref:serine/threonine-protein kinase n=1 Tax=Streptomyces sp. NPDC088116 TaxID=3365825 RepID=UPI00382BE18F
MHVGRTVGGRYRLTQGPLRGGTGEVWLARDVEWGRDVVLKRVLTGDAGFDGLRTEARALARFSHPHVVTLHHAEQVGRGRKATYWLVMEYVAGGSLDDRPPLSPVRAARVGVQIADALVALHAEGIVHGDIKPANVVVTLAGLAKLADFGAAYRVGGMETITSNGAVSYTPDFAAPEVVRGQPEPASDIFSLGAMLCALVTGEPPRPRVAGAVDPREPYDPYIAARHAARGQVELNTDDAEFGPLGDILPAMLDRDPRHRPDAAAVRGLLEEIAGLQEPLPPAEPGTGRGTPYASLGHDERADAARGSGSSDRGGRWASPAALVRTLGSRPLLLGTVALALALAVAVPVTLRDADHRNSGTDDPRPPGSSTGPPQKVLSVIGDHRAADPCAVAEPSALARFGDAQLDRAYGNFDRCDVIVDTGTGSPVDVEIHFGNGGRSELSAPRKTVGRVSVVDEPAESDACGHTLLSAGDDDVNITVIAKQNEGTAPLCAMADTATDSAVEVLNRGVIDRRSPAPPANSLAHEDACTLLDADALEIVPGIDARRPEVGFGNWDCEWESTTNGLWVGLRFDRGQPPTAADGTLTRINGRSAVVRPDAEGEHTCLVRVVHRSYDDHDGNTTVETLNVTVGGDRSKAQLRRMALELADVAAVEVG